MDNVLKFPHIWLPRDFSREKRVHESRIDGGVGGGIQGLDGIVSNLYGSNVIPPPLSPTDWWDPQYNAYQDTGTSTPATANNDPVGHLSSQASGTALTNTGGTDRGLLKTNAINSLPVIQYDGSNDFLKASFSISMPFSIYMLVRIDTWVNNHMLVSSADQATFGIYCHTSSPNIASYGGLNGDSTDNTNMVVGSFKVVSAVWTSAVKLRVNKTTRTTGGQSSGSHSLGGVTIAQNGPAGSFGAVSVGRVAIYNTAHSDADNDTVAQAFMDIYGL